MGFRSAIAGFVLAIAPLVCQANEQPVVIELYTSQGCSSCPPADKLLGKLAAHSDVLALALHVDYWDYIGWKDQFGDPSHTKRQKAYARAAGQRTIYTPQMVIGGVDHVVGHKPMQVMDLVQKHKARASPVDLRLVRTGDRVAIMANTDAQLEGPVVVQLIRYMASATVEIERGENAGRRLTYSNIVTDWDVLGEWDGASSLRMDADANGPVAVILQKAGHGPIVAAARAE